MSGALPDKDVMKSRIMSFAQVSGWVSVRLGGSKDVYECVHDLVRKGFLVPDSQYKRVLYFKITQKGRDYMNRLTVERKKKTDTPVKVGDQVMVNGRRMEVTEIRLDEYGEAIIDLLYSEPTNYVCRFEEITAHFPKK